MQKLSFMNGIHYITNDTGQKTGIIINFQETNTRVENLSEDFIEDIKSVFRKYFNGNSGLPKISAYSAEGSPLTKAEFSEHILSLSEQVKNGTAKTYTQKEVDKLIETW